MVCTCRKFYFLYFQLSLSNFWSTFDTHPQFHFCTSGCLGFSCFLAHLLSQEEVIFPPFLFILNLKSIHAPRVFLPKTCPINLLIRMEKDWAALGPILTLRCVLLWGRFPCSSETLRSSKSPIFANEAFRTWELVAELCQILIMADAECQTQEAPLGMSSNITRTGPFLPFPDSFTFSWGSAVF